MFSSEPKDPHCDKFQFINNQLKPMKNTLNQRYLQDHTKYHILILNKKIDCYNKYNQSLQKNSKQLKQAIHQYYKCYRRVNQMINWNHRKLQGQSFVLNQKLNNCITQCSGKNYTNQGFEKCAMGENGCFKFYQKKADKLYQTMYKVIFEGSEKKSQASNPTMIVNNEL